MISRAVAGAEIGGTLAEAPAAPASTGGSEGPVFGKVLAQAEAAPAPAATNDQAAATSAMVTPEAAGETMDAVAGEEIAEPALPVVDGALLPDVWQILAASAAVSVAPTAAPASAAGEAVIAAGAFVNMTGASPQQLKAAAAFQNVVALASAGAATAKAIAVTQSEAAPVTMPGGEGDPAALAALVAQAAQVKQGKQGAGAAQAGTDWSVAGADAASAPVATDEAVVATTPPAPEPVVQSAPVEAPVPAAEPAVSPTSENLMASAELRGPALPMDAGPNAPGSGREAVTAEAPVVDAVAPTVEAMPDAQIVDSFGGMTAPSTQAGQPVPAQPSFQDATALQLDDLMIADAVQDQWLDRLASDIQTMVQGDHKLANLKLMPENLGTLAIQIEMDQQQTNVRFTVESQAAQQAIAEATHKLVAIAEQNGVKLDQATVDLGQRRQQQQQQSERTAAHWVEQMKNGRSVETEAPAIVRQVRGLFERFA